MSTVPVDSFWNPRVPVPSVARRRRAVAARVRFFRKLRTEAAVGARFPGYACRIPSAEGLTAVTVTETDFAVGGMRQGEAVTGNERRAPAESFGPPRGDVAFRVSIARHGVTG
jgi:hypothetical protein